MSKNIRIACVVGAATLLAFAVLSESATAQGWRNRGGGGGEWRSRGGRDGGRDRGGDGERRSEDKSNGSGGNSSSNTPSAQTSSEEYAKGIVKMYDKNGDKMLQKDEQKELNSTNRAADLDSDGVITIDELARHSVASATPVASPSTDSGEKKGDRDKGEKGTSAKREYTWLDGGSKEGAKRRSYRFSTASDHLPSSLPSFFSRDKNGDGQVSMSEYSRTWSERTVAEFRKLDLNNDGIITAKEASRSAGSGG